MLISLFAVSCSNSPQHFHYRGDGNFVDKGPSAGSMRYVLTLGSLSSSERGTRIFTTGPLPRETLHLGFRIDKPIVQLNASTLKPVVPGDYASVAVRVIERETENVIVEHEGPLNAEVWTFNLGSHSPFAYGDTSFVPTSRIGYNIIAEVLEPDSHDLLLHVELFGGGWQ